MRASCNQHLSLSLSQVAWVFFFSFFPLRKDIILEQTQVAWVETLVVCWLLTMIYVCWRWWWGVSNGGLSKEKKSGEMKKEEGEEKRKRRKDDTSVSRAANLYWALIWTRRSEGKKKVTGGPFLSTVSIESFFVHRIYLKILEAMIFMIKIRNYRLSRKKKIDNNEKPYSDNWF